MHCELIQLQYRPILKKKKKKKRQDINLKGPRSIPQWLSVHYAFVDLQQRRQWCEDFERQVLLDKKKMTTKKILSRCHWMCFMSNKRDPLSELGCTFSPVFLFSWRRPQVFLPLRTLCMSSLTVAGGTSATVRDQTEDCFAHCWKTLILNIRSNWLPFTPTFQIAI